jgi:glycine betaine transporter
MFELNTLLVPVDFSPISRGVFEQALHLARGDDAAIILLHVIDPAVADLAATLGLGSRDAALAAMRARAQRELDEYKTLATGAVEVQTIMSEGTPFLEILLKAEDFQVDAILMGKHDARGRIEKLLFGTTAEHVIRGATRAVIVLPVET